MYPWFSHSQAYAKPKPISSQTQRQKYILDALGHGSGLISNPPNAMKVLKGSATEYSVVGPRLADMSKTDT